MKAHAHPTKEFFINMITRDIGLDECIFDLLDNCIDGANGVLERAEIQGEHDRDKYSSFEARISFSKDEFLIEDNCGGIPLNEAIDYAFHFGRRQDAPKDSDTPIGLYGIGMKRAVFKIGKKIEIVSATKEAPNEAFCVEIDVDEWSKDPNDWDFNLDEFTEREFVGTKIKVNELRRQVASEFSDMSFTTYLIKEIAKYYSFFIQSGFSIYVNGNKVEPYGFRLKESESFEPIKFVYIDETGVEVEIAAGLAGSPPEDTSNDNINYKDVEYWGWFVSCNDRIVLAGDKSKKTVWGDGQFQIWHPQYNGFMGIVSFKSTSPEILPWTTTKREIDDTNEVYRRAVSRMKEATRAYIAYTNSRKEELEQAKMLEGTAEMRSISELPTRETMKLPQFSSKPKVKTASIQYSKPLELISKVAESLGNRNMPNTKVGKMTFDYYVRNELDDCE